MNTNCFFALFLWASVGEAVEPPLSRSADTPAQHLLQEFAVGQMKLQSFIIESENTSEFGTNQSQFCFDARVWRSASRITTWRKPLDRDLARKDQPSYTSHLWDGRAFYTYTRNPESAQRDRLMIDTNRSNAKHEALRLLQTAFRGAPPLGYFHGCSERVDAILAESKTLVVRDKQEQVGNSMCHVIDAATKHGQFTLWLDPRHGYNIAQAQMVKRPGDSFMDFPQPMPPGLEIRQMVKGVRFEQIAGSWVPMEADIELAYKDSKEPMDPKKNHSSKIHHKKTKVQLSPAFSTLLTFVPDDVRDGTRAAFSGANRSPILQLYRWQGGQLKPEASSTADRK